MGRDSSIFRLKIRKFKYLSIYILISNRQDPAVRCHYIISCRLYYCRNNFQNPGSELLLLLSTFPQREFHWVMSCWRLLCTICRLSRIRFDHKRRPIVHSVVLFSGDSAHRDIVGLGNNGNELRIV